MEPVLSPESAVDDEVTVYARDNRRGSWHVDPACPELKQGRTVRYEAQVHLLGQWLLGLSRRPCRVCALETVLTAELRPDATRPREENLLVCPNVHRGRTCKGCALLARVAAAAGLPTLELDGRVAARAGIEPYGVLAEVVFAAYELTIPVSDEALEVAWRMAHPDPAASPVKNLRARILHPVAQLPLQVAHIVTAT